MKMLYFIKFMFVDLKTLFTNFLSTVNFFKHLILVQDECIVYVENTNITIKFLAKKNFYVK